MSVEHYFIVKFTVPTVDVDFGSPIPFAGGTIPTVTNKTYSFTNTALPLPISDVFKRLTNVSETSPKLKAGLGVASRASATFTFDDFIGDPNEDSPNLIADPTLAKQGSFFPKLNQRQIMSNKDAQIEFWKFEGGTHTLVKTHFYRTTKLKRGSGIKWTLECKDILYKADQTKSQFPRLLTGRLNSAMTVGTTSITFPGDVADWSSTANIAVAGNELLPITNVAGSSTSVTLTVTRATTINVGSRTYINEIQTHDAGAEIFRGRLYVGAHLADVITDIWIDSDIDVSFFNKTEIEAEIDTWLLSYKDKVDAIYYEANDAIEVLNNICATFLLDIWAEPTDGTLQVRATNPWLTTTATLTEGEEINYNSLREDAPEKLQYSRAYLLYDKQNLTESDDDVQFLRSSLGINTEFEGEEFHDQITYKKMAKSLILSSTSESDEIADTNTTRFVQRFSRSPKVYNFNTEESKLNYNLGDVIGIISQDLQDESGNISTDIRAQVVRITPQERLGRTYAIEAVTYNPFAGSVGGGDKFITDTFDINLFVQAGAPPASGTFNFIFDTAVFGQNIKPQAIEVGSFPSGSIVNVVCINGSILAAAGGNAGSFTANGTDGGDCLVGKTGVTVNVYLNGNTGDLGNGSYTSDGELIAPGGGGGGGTFFSPGGGEPDEGGSGGGGGAGKTGGNGGNGQIIAGVNGEDGNNAFSVKIGGSGGGGFNDASTRGGDGGDGGSAGGNGGGGSGGTGGAAGKGILLNSGTINILTNGDTGRFVNGNGDAPTSLT